MKRLLPVASLVMLALMLLPGMSSAESYDKKHTINLPKNSKSFDVSVIDDENRLYYLADRTSGVIQVVNVDTGAVVKQIKGFHGFDKDNDHSGPNGVELIGHELWVGDAGGKVQVVDLTTGSVVATISVGGTTRADESAYDDKNGVLWITSPGEDPPYLSAISVKDRKVLGKVVFDKSVDGAEQPRYSKATGMVYQSVPESKDNAGGEIDVIDVAAMKVTAVLALTDCNPHGIALGPNNQIAVGCSKSAIDKGGKAHSLIIDAVSGKVLFTIPEFGGSDLVVYNPADNRYYFAARDMTSDGTKAGKPNPVLGIVDAATGKTVAVVPTGTGAHAVSVDARTGQAFVPVNDAGILVFAAAAAGPAAPPPVTPPAVTPPAVTPPAVIPPAVTPAPVLPNTGTGTATLALTGSALLAAGLLLTLKRKARKA